MKKSLQIHGICKDQTVDKVYSLAEGEKLRDFLKVERRRTMVRQSRTFGKALENVFIFFSKILSGIHRI